MKVDMFDINKFIELNHCKQVTSPVIFQSNKMPNPDGLLSYEIFGYSEDDRKNVFAYIDLKDYYIHPIVYAMLSARMGSIKYILSGSKYCQIVNGKLTIVPDNSPGSGTGLEFIYKNFEKINWIDELEENEIASLDKKTRLKFLKTLTKEEFFVNKWLVLPAHYRETSADDSSMGDVINQLYKDLLAATRSIRSGFTFEIFGHATKMRVQELLLQIYQTTMTPVSGKSLDVKSGELRGVSKNSLLARSLMGKTIDHGANTVIVAPITSDADSVNSLPVPFGTAMLPLPTCISLFNPFFVHEVSIILDEYCESLHRFVQSEYGPQYSVNRSQYNSSVVDKIISRFIKSSYERFDPILFEVYENNKLAYDVEFNLEEYKSRIDAQNRENAVIRPLTYTDLMYQAAIRILKNKHVLITRHPVTNNKNIYPALVNPLSTGRTRKIYINNMNADIYKTEIIEYPNYPYIKYDGNKNLPSPYFEFIGTSIIGNAVLKSLGGDYDGDMVFIRGLYSLQANAEADAMIKAKSNILGATGAPIRGLDLIAKDLTMSLYELTKD